MKNIRDMTLAEFKKVPALTDKTIRFDSLVILPANQDECNGYDVIDFIACIDGKPIGKFESDDVIEINGKMGWGHKYWEDASAPSPKVVPPVRWRIHCLFKSGLMALYASGKKELFASDDFGFKLYSVKC